MILVHLSARSCTNLGKHSGGPWLIRWWRMWSTRRQYRSRMASRIQRTYLGYRARRHQAVMLDVVRISKEMPQLEE